MTRARRSNRSRRPIERPATPGLEETHTSEAISARLHAGPRASYLREFVLGAMDGTVTTFVVVAGATGAGLSAGVVVILGVANLLADGFSMAVGNFLGARSEEQRRARLRREEERHVDLVPAGEREELRQMLAGQGLGGDVLDQAVTAISADRELLDRPDDAAGARLCCPPPEPAARCGGDVRRVRNDRGRPAGCVHCRCAAVGHRRIAVSLEHGTDRGRVPARRRRSRGMSWTRPSGGRPWRS